jgi:hypothetical protein
MIARQLRKEYERNFYSLSFAVNLSIDDHISFETFRMLTIRVEREGGQPASRMPTKGVLHAHLCVSAGGGRRLREVWERSYVAFLGWQPLTEG